MNRIILAFAPENASLAQSIDRQLNRIGIPFEYANEAVAAQIDAAGEPTVLLVTDNFLKNRACLDGLLPVLQKFGSENRLVAVLADGQNAAGQAVSTQIDRMSNALHYMKYWQDAWLALSDRHQHLEGEAKARFEPELDAVRSIANQVGDLIGALREIGYVRWEQFEANDFEVFFQKFNLQDWHGQYKRLAAQSLESQELADAAHLPEMPVAGGLLAPAPVPQPEIPAPPAVPETAPPAPIEEPDVPDSNEPAMAGEDDFYFEEETTADDAPAVAQAVRDAWFWLDQGHPQRGLDVFQSALEQYPDNETLRTEYEAALAKTGQAGENVAQTVEQDAPQQTTTHTPEHSNEAKSYDLMGDMAAERGDYLFAKYCWDRVAEIDANYPGIFRKTGLMTAEHLQEYRETAAIYLRKALETHPDDPAVHAALGRLGSSEGMEAEQKVGTPSAQVQDAPAAQPVSGTDNRKLVLITGATSGIGRATAEIFAQHGYRLILTGRRVDRLVALKNQFEADFGSDVLLLPFDVRDAGAVEAALGNLPESYQEIDILINNAGLAKGLSPIHEGSLEQWETMIDTNVKGLLYVTRLVSPGMVRRRSGHIVNVCSSAGRETYPNGNVYCATKFAVDALTKSMRFDLHAHNIRVGQVSPGHVEETEFAITRFDGDGERASIYNDFQPLKASDVADAIFYMVTRPPHVNIQDVQMYSSQQASSMVIDRSGR